MKSTTNLLVDKKILITGGASGIGLAAVRACIEAGASVLVVDPSHLPDDLRHNNQVTHVQQSIASSDIDRIVAEAIAVFGLPNGLVNNAAAIFRGSFGSATIDSLTRAFDTNVQVPILLSQCLMDKCKDCQGGHSLSVVNVGSTNAKVGASDQFEYSVSKAALSAFTKNASNACPPDQIRINTLNVAWTLTKNEIERKIKDGFAQGWQQQQERLGLPLGRLLTPEEVANHIVFWLSDLSFPVTGAVYEVAQNGR